MSELTRRWLRTIERQMSFQILTQVMMRWTQRMSLMAAAVNNDSLQDMLIFEGGKNNEKLMLITISPWAL